jgi:hypothetical protein
VWGEDEGLSSFVRCLGGSHRAGVSWKTGFEKASLISLSILVGFSTVRRWPFRNSSHPASRLLQNRSDSWLLQGVYAAKRSRIGLGALIEGCKTVRYVFWLYFSSHYVRVESRSVRSYRTEVWRKITMRAGGLNFFPICLIWLSGSYYKVAGRKLQHSCHLYYLFYSLHTHRSSLRLFQSIAGGKSHVVGNNS